MRVFPGSVRLQAAPELEGGKAAEGEGWFRRAERRQRSLPACYAGRDESKRAEKHFLAKKITSVGSAGFGESSCKAGIPVIVKDQPLSTFISCVC